MDQHVGPSREQFDAFKALPRDTPVAMLNLVPFREEQANQLTIEASDDERSKRLSTVAG